MVLPNRVSGFQARQAYSTFNSSRKPRWLATALPCGQMPPRRACRFRPSLNLAANGSASSLDKRLLMLGRVSVRNTLSETAAYQDTAAPIGLVASPPPPPRACNSLDYLRRMLGWL